MHMRLFVAVVGFSVVCAVTTAGLAASSSEPVSLYGITIGEKLALPECSTDYNDKPSQMCARKSSDWYPPIDPRKMLRMGIVFAAGARPAAAKYDFFDVLIFNDRVEEIMILTRGTIVQEDVQRQLEEKFGPPAEKQISQVQNRFGGTFDVIRSGWILPGQGFVRFDGVLNSLDTGAITASTYAAAKFREDQSKQEQSNVPKL